MSGAATEFEQVRYDKSEGGRLDHTLKGVASKRIACRIFQDAVQPVPGDSQYGLRTDTVRKGRWVGG